MELKFVSHYISHQPDASGFITYSAEENAVWHTLFTRQFQLLENRACHEFIQGLTELQLDATSIPQLPNISKHLQKISGWEVAAVPALISARQFFELLANKRFPAATFIRHRESLDYVKEPDIFHEIFGHCPMLTNTVYANFIHQYANQVLNLPEAHWPLLQRLFWFTVEFGLIRTPEGIRAYGGGILSSIRETVYSVESDMPLRVDFNPIAALRTPYRIDQLQPVYFVINHYDSLYALTYHLPEIIKKSQKLGEYPPLFAIDENNPNIHINAC